MRMLMVIVIGYIYNVGIRLIVRVDYRVKLFVEEMFFIW